VDIYCEGDKFTEKDVSEYPFRKRGVGEKVNPVINKRIRIIREDLNLSQTMFASELKLPRHTIANIENNKQNISATLMEKLILKYNVNLNWFIIGTGKPFLLSSSNKTNKGT
jgi:DNA-binding XRE family transcriptional regulator